MVYIERNFSSLSKLVAMETLSYSLRRPMVTRCMGSSPVHRHFEKSHRSRRPLVGPGLYVTGSNHGASHKTKSQVSPDIPCPNPNVMGPKPGDVKTQNRNPTGHGSYPGLFFVQTSNLNVMGSSPRTLFCSES